MEDLKKKAIIEALIFVAGEPVTLDSIIKATDLQKSEIKQLADELIAEYRAKNSGILIVEIAEGYQMVTNPDFSAWVKKFKNINQTGRLSQPALETLAIIAYRQPITRLEIDQFRGVNSDGAVKSLLDKRLIKIVGKKETPGRPFLYGTTKEFLQYFGLKNLSDLPPINDFLKDEAA
jgi:segregation and condensation protein B